MFTSIALLVALSPGFLSQGGPPAPIWLAGALANDARVAAVRRSGRGAADAPAGAHDLAITRHEQVEALEADVSRSMRLTWGCGGDLEFREAETAHRRLVADTVVICGAHHLDDVEMRLDVRARHLILREAQITTRSEGYVDVRAQVLTLEGASRVTSSAPPALEPAFSSSAALYLSAGQIAGDGHLEVQTEGADIRRARGS